MASLLQNCDTYPLHRLVSPTGMDYESYSLSGYQSAVYLVHLSQSEAVRGAVHPTPASIEHMGIDHRRADILMPKELLNRSNIVPVLQ